MHCEMISGSGIVSPSYLRESWQDSWLHSEELVRRNLFCAVEMLKSGMLIFFFLLEVYLMSRAVWRGVCKMKKSRDSSGTPVGSCRGQH